MLLEQARSIPSPQGMEKDKMCIIDTDRGVDYNCQQRLSQPLPFESW